MKKEVKDTIIVELGEKLKEYPHFYLVDLTGLNAEKTVDLRRKCFKNEIKLLVVKNKLLHNEQFDVVLEAVATQAACLLCIESSQVYEIEMGKLLQLLSKFYYDSIF